MSAWCVTVDIVRARDRSMLFMSSPRPLKRLKLAHLTPDSFKNGVFLAPMVRSGARMLPQFRPASSTNYSQYRPG